MPSLGDSASSIRWDDKTIAFSNFLLEHFCEQEISINSPLVAVEISTKAFAFLTSITGCLFSQPGFHRPHNVSITQSFSGL